MDSVVLQLPCVVAVGVRSAWCSPCRGNPRHGAGSTKLGVRPAHWSSTHPTGAHEYQLAPSRPYWRTRFCRKRPERQIRSLHVPYQFEPVIAQDYKPSSSGRVRWTRSERSWLTATSKACQCRC